MKHNITYYVVSLGVSLYLPTAKGQSSQIEKSLEPGRIQSRIQREIGRLEVDQTVKLLDVDLFDGLSAAVKYKYEVEPSFKGDFHLRMDRWILDTQLRPGDILEEFYNTRVGVTIEKGAQVLFIRPFKSKLDSMTALPYTPKQIPFTAKKVASELQVGDFVSLTSKLNFIASASTLAMGMTSIGSAATHYMISGEFQIHVLKRSDHEVRLKLIGLRKKQTGFGARIGFTSDDFKVTGLRVVDRRIEKLFDATDIFRMKLEKSKSNILLVDYFLDLNVPEVANAYDSVLNQFFTLKSVGLSNPFLSNSDLSDKLISDLTPLETLYDNQRLFEEAKQTVKRVFKGKNDINVQLDSSFKFGVLLFSLGQDRQYVENGLTSLDSEDQPSYFRYHTFQRLKRASAFFSFWKTESLSRASILLSSDKNMAIKEIKDIIFEWDYRDKKLSPSEFRMIQDAVRQNIPQRLYSQIDWSPWLPKKQRVNARIVMGSVLHPEALNYVGVSGFEGLKRSLESYLREIPAPEASPSNSFPVTHEDDRDHRDVVQKYQEDIFTISLKLSQVFDSRGQVTPEEKSKAFADLRFNNLFIEIGPGFLISLLPQDKLHELLFFKFSVVADNEPPIHFEWGEVQDRRVYQAVTYIRAVLSERSHDLVIEYAR